MYTLGTGRIGQDAEVFTTKKDTKVITFSLAEDQSYKDSDGKTVEKVSWHKCVLYRKTASDKLLAILTKGQMLTVIGNYVENKFETKDGANATEHLIEVNEFTPINPPKKTDD